jgi:predicted hydrocarbon binding protein
VQDREPGPPGNYLNEFFKFDPVANKTEDKVFGCTAILTNEEFWDAIQEGLYPLLESNWSVILFEMGSRYGKKLGENARRKALDTDQAVKFLEFYGLMAGWGKFHTSPITLSMGKLAKDINVTVEDNFFARSSRKKKADSPRCFFVAGLLAGIAEGLFGERHECFERKCIACGADKCEFLLSRRHP